MFPASHKPPFNIFVLFFFLNGTVNRHNYRYWSDSNPHWVHTQHPLKLYVYAEIFEERIVGILFLDGNLTREKYLEFLEETVEPILIDNIENNQNYLVSQYFNKMAHYALCATQFLEQHFPGHWIGSEVLTNGPHDHQMFLL